MKPSEDPKLLQIVSATGEIFGKQLSTDAYLIFLADLDNFTSSDVSAALSKCRKELRTFPTVSDVISRIEDGRPGVEEAWMMIPKDEYASVVWNNEISEAFGICRIMISEDMVAARMAFKESYSKIVSRNRSAGYRPVWSPSFGFDKFARADAVREAIDKGRITLDHAVLLLPDFEKQKKPAQSLIGGGFATLGEVVGKFFEQTKKISHDNPDLIQ